MDVITLTINGEPYVAVPRTEYERLTGKKGKVLDAAGWARAKRKAAKKKSSARSTAR